MYNYKKQTFKNLKTAIDTLEQDFLKRQNKKYYTYLKKYVTNQTYSYVIHFIGIRNENYKDSNGTIFQHNQCSIAKPKCLVLDGLGQPIYKCKGQEYTYQDLNLTQEQIKQIYKNDLELIKEINGGAI